MDVFGYHINVVPSPPDFATRSGSWPTVRANHLKKEPKCLVCDIAGCEVHHVKPFHLFPDLELVDSNLMSLCRVHHFLFGHLLEWAAWNPEVRADVDLWHKKIKDRKVK